MYRTIAECTTPNKVPQQSTATGLYWDRMEPAFKMLRFMGYIPFKINKVTESVDPSPGAWLWAGIAYVVQVLIIVIGYSSRSDTKYWNTYDSTLESITRILLTSTSIFSFIGWLENYKIIKYINNWNIFINNLNKVATAQTNLFDKQKLKIVLISILAVIPALVILDEVTLLDEFQPFYDLSNIIIFTVPALLTAFWIANCYFIVQIARCFRKNLFTVLQTKRDPVLINTYRLLWLQLRQNAIDLPEVFKGSLGCLLATNLLTLIMVIYSLITALFHIKDYSRIIGLLVPTAWNVITLISICEFSDLVSCEIGQRLISTILILPVNKYRNLSAEMDLLFDTIERKSPDLILIGCIKINRHLLIEMTSLIVSYNIVLTQFDPTNK